MGRLATYKYYNMDQVVAQALVTYRKISGLEPAVAAPVEIITPTVVTV